MFYAVIKMIVFCSFSYLLSLESFDVFERSHLCSPGQHLFINFFKYSDNCYIVKYYYDLK